MGIGGAVGLFPTTPSQIGQILQATVIDQATLNAILTFLSGIMLAAIAWIGRTAILRLQGRNKAIEIEATKDKNIDEATAALEAQTEAKASTRLFNLVDKLQKRLDVMQAQNIEQAKRIAVLEAALIDRDKQIASLREELLSLRKQVFIGKEEIKADTYPKDLIDDERK